MSLILKEKLRKTLSLKTKLLIFEYKEKFPQLSPNEISTLFNLNHGIVKQLFDKGYIIVQSKINKK